MATAKVAVSIDRRILRELDRWVAAGEFPSRSGAGLAALLARREWRLRNRAGRLGEEEMGEVVAGLLELIG